MAQEMFSCHPLVASFILVVLIMITITAVIIVNVIPVVLYYYHLCCLLLLLNDIIVILCSTYILCRCISLASTLEELLQYHRQLAVLTVVHI